MRFLFFGEKGFNLFSALVAAIILMVGVVLVNMLISTEDTISREVYLMTNSFSLNDAAAIARADALQTFNYNFRERIEYYLTVSEDDIENDAGIHFLINTGEISADSSSWDLLVDGFKKSILYTDFEDDGKAFSAVIKYVSEKTINQFYEGRYGRYNVQLNEKGLDAINKLEHALTKTLEDNFDDVDFFEVIGCDYSDCEVGSFYFVIPLDRMSPEVFDALPLIVVKDLISGEEIKFPVLQRARLNIFVPTRFFKALHTAWKKSSSAVIDFQDLLGSGPTVNTAMLGFCDSGCEPRSNPLVVGGDKWGKDCVGSGSNSIYQLLTGNNHVVSLLSSPQYLIGERNGANELTAFARANICVFGESKYVGYDSDKLGDNGLFRNYNLENGVGHPIKKYESNIKKAGSCPFNLIRAVPVSANTKIIEGTNAGVKLQCTSIKQVEAVSVFEDVNPVYIVKGEVNRFAIGIRSKEFPIQDKDLGVCISGSNACNKK